MSVTASYNEPFGTLDHLFRFVEIGWENQEKAQVTIKTITRKNQFPKWEDCKKDHLYFGVIRRKRGDRIVIVRHQLANELDCRVAAEELTPKDLMLLVWPERKDMHCSKCGEFSTRINMDGRCVDCPEA